MYYLVLKFEIFKGKKKSILAGKDNRKYNRNICVDEYERREKS